MARDGEQVSSPNSIDANAPKRVLFVAEGVTLAHVGRSIRLASILHDAGVEVELACDSRYGQFLADLAFPVRPIWTIPSEAFREALDAGRPVYSAETLTDYVRDDRAVIEAAKPDVVVGDFRLSLSVSARLLQVPYVNVTNAYWSPFARPRFRMPSLRFASLVGGSFGDALFAMVRPLAFAVHARPMNRVRRAQGLPALESDVRQVYCDGDLTLYADLPQVIPTLDAPAHHRHIGPVLWSPEVDLPHWWPEATKNGAFIYVSLGSSGPARLLPMVVDALSTLGLPIVVATAGRRGGDLPTRERVWVTDFLPGDLVASRSRVVVCNGGSATSQQALAHGVPVIGIASNLDQYLNMGYVERYGAGVLVRADQATPPIILQAAKRALEDRQVREQAVAFARLAGSTHLNTEFVSALASVLDTRSRRLS